MLPENPYKYPLDGLVSDGGLLPANREFFVILRVFDYDAWVKIMSSTIEGAETIYPFEYNEMVEIILDGAFMNCDQLAQCLLTNEVFLESLANNPIFLDALAGQLTQQQLVEANNQNSSSQNVKNLAQTTSDKDAVWSGCFELTEYMLDLIKTLCFFLQSANNIVDIASQLYDRQKRKKFDWQAEDQLNNGIRLGDDGELINMDGATYEFVPNILGQLVQTISESAMVSFLTEIFSLGASLVLADINDTRAESISCEFFNKIVCNDSVPKDPPYTFTNETVFETCNSMIGLARVGLAGNAIGICGTIVGVANNFTSLFDLGECHRNFRIGMRSPSSEWVEICENCNPPALTWSQTFNFAGNANGFVSRIAGGSVNASNGWISSGAIYGSGSSQYKEAGCKRTVNLGASNIKSTTVNYLANSANAFGTQRIEIGGVFTTLPKGVGILTHSRNFTIPITGSNVEIAAFLHFLINQGANNTFAIQSITLSGDGVNPFS